jgi:hypothetical protein
MDNRGQSYREYDDPVKGSIEGKDDTVDWFDETMEIKIKWIVLRTLYIVCIYICSRKRWNDDGRQNTKKVSIVNALVGSLKNNIVNMDGKPENPVSNVLNIRVFENINHICRLLNTGKWRFTSA